MDEKRQDLVWIYREIGGDPFETRKDVGYTKERGSYAFHETDLAIVLGWAKAWQAVFPCCPNEDCPTNRAFDNVVSLLGDTAYHRYEVVRDLELRLATDESEGARALPPTR